MPSKKIPSSPRGARERLLSAALGLFAAKGYAATSVRHILTAAEVTAPVLYYHFGNKEGLFRALAEEALRKHEEAIDRALARPGSATEKIRGFCFAMAEVKREYVALAPTAEAALSGGSELIPLEDLRDFARRTRAKMARLVRLGIRQGLIRECDVDSIVLVVFACMDFSTRRVALDLEERSAGDPLARMLDALLAALAPSDAPDRTTVPHRKNATSSSRRDRLPPTGSRGGS